MSDIHEDRSRDPELIRDLRRSAELIDKADRTYKPDRLTVILENQSYIMKALARIVEENC